ncbi:methyltransferase family protein [Azospirillum brasilense]|uniref:Methyltransferase family protein n=1 Tax=Azospirillum brasilense TaxID=192 RepID=A0A560AGQ5_AZOBR|nr:class I SAM-dependent methyltransferase [Azospirillum brasilense]TWA59509.1 methyltransferase family protein [Azospirillum brasilense]
MEKIAMGGAEIINWTQTIAWEAGDRHLEATCPACGDTGAKPVRLAVRSPWPPHPEQPLVTCAACGTAFHPTMGQPPYEAVLDPLVDVYLEQNAGIDVMAELLAAVDPSGIRRYIEIGCGFGFLLDYARVAFGWDARGFDPGYSARFGREALGVDIQHIYLNSAADAGSEPFDLALCAEVIEHVFEPEKLLVILRDSLTANGTLLLTTPSASGIRPDTQPGTLLSLLCPGYHYALYSPKGMEALLRRVGFKSVSVIDRGHTLRVAASVGDELRADLARPFDRRSYHDYLRTRIGTTDPVSPLGVGYRYRLLKELTNAGQFEAARAAQAQVAAVIRQRWNIDLSDPAALHAALSEAPLPASIEAYHEHYPFCLGSVLYFSGILAWLADGRRDIAQSWFRAATLAGERMRATLHIIGADDEESEELMWRARCYVSHLRVWSEPAKAAEDIRQLANAPSPLLGERVPARILEDAQRKIFVDLVNLGQYAAADGLAGPVEAALPSGGEALASLAFALGILTLNHRKAPRAAAAFFGRAHQACLDLPDRETAPVVQSLLWPALYHQGQSLANAGLRQEAGEALRGLLKPAAGLPSVPLDLRARTELLVRTQRLPV